MIIHTIWSISGVVIVAVFMTLTVFIHGDQYFYYGFRDAITLVLGGGILAILIGAFSYPLGNRKMMEHCPSVLNTFQRVFGMTLCSMPFWIVTAVTAFVKSGFPGKSQLIQSAGVALFSGVIATVLFFYATDLVKKNEKQLAVVEATQLQSSLRIHFGLCKVKNLRFFSRVFFRLYGKIIRIKKNDETNIERMSEVRKVRGALIGLVCLLTCTLPAQADEVTGAVKKWSFSSAAVFAGESKNEFQTFEYARDYLKKS